MALRVLTPGNLAHCSDCAAEVPPGAPACSRCNEGFAGEVEALLCERCRFFAPRNATECVNCGVRFGGATDAIEEQFLAHLKEQAPVPPTSSPGQQTIVITDPVQGEALLSKLNEPVRRLLAGPRRRLEAMDSLVARARKRISVLESSQHPIETREREELKRQVGELLGEREDLLKIEQGIQEMARVYRGIVQMQEQQLRDRESALDTRVEELRTQLERWEKERRDVEEREHEVGRREVEFRLILEHLRKRDMDIAEKEGQLQQKIRDVENTDIELKRRLSAIAAGSMDIRIEAKDQAVSEMKVRLSDLEEQVERLMDERNRLTLELSASDARKDEVKQVLKILDELLGKLPREELHRFARSNLYSLYEKVLQRYGV